MSRFGVMTITDSIQDSIQGPPAPANILGNEINRAKMGDAVGNLSSGQGMLILFSDIRDSLLKIAENTLRTNELLKVLKGTDAEQRDKNIDDSDTDGDKDKPKDRGPSAFDKLKGIFSKLNPFSDGGPGPLGTAVIAGLGLLGLSMFGDEAQEGIEYLLNAIKNGKIGEILSDFGDTIKEKFVEFKEIVKLAVEKITGVYESITNYINQFDVDGDGELSPDEQKKLQENIEGKIGDFIYNVIGETLLGITSVFGLVTSAGILARIGTLAGTGAGVGLFGGAALVALAAAGAFKLFQNVQFAMNEETGKIDAGKYLAGKSEEGSLANASINAFDKGLTGVMAGGIIGFLLGGPGGMLAGAKIGGMVGASIGAMAGYKGSDETNSFLSTLENMKYDMEDSFDSMIKGVPSSAETDKIALQTKLNNKREDLDELEKKRAERIATNKNTRNIDFLIEAAKIGVTKAEKALANADYNAADRETGGELSDVTKKKEVVGAELKVMIDAFNNPPTVEYDPGGAVVNSGLGLVTQEQINIKQAKFDTLKKKEADLKAMSLFGRDAPNQPTFRTDSGDRIKETTDSFFGGINTNTGGNIIANNNNVTDNSTKVVANAPGGNGFNPHPSEEVRMLNRINGIGV